MPKLSRRNFMERAASAGVGAALAGCATGGQPKPVSTQRPNIIVIVTDDQRWDAMGCAENPIIRTPNMDALAADGTYFTNAFVTTPICCTSRASIFTGMYGLSHGVRGFFNDLPDDLFANTYPAVLRKAGYRTGFVGKYGFGRNIPRDSFDFFVHSPARYLIEVDGEERHATEIITCEALEFLDSSGSQPFCLSISYKAPHSQDYAPRPYPPDPALEELYCDAQIPAPELAQERYYEALPEFLKDSEGRRRWKNRFATPTRFQESMRDMYRLIAGVDIGIGRIRAKLDELGAADNTVIIFTSDNGAFIGERGLAGKWYAWEDSIRVPFIVYDPRAPRTRRGRRPKEMALNIDIAPTVLELAGEPVPQTTQGRSLAPLLKGEGADWRQDWYFEHLFMTHPRIPPSEGVRTERWKYFRWVDTSPVMEELYDLKHDPLETHDLAASPQHRQVLARMRARWEAFRAELPMRTLKDPRTR